MAENNKSNRTFPVFFYGLYMDSEILTNLGVTIRDPIKAYVDDYSLVIGKKATLMRQKGGRTVGMIYSLTHEEVKKLYQDLPEYVTEPILVHEIIDPHSENLGIAAITCVLLEPPASGENNHEYSEKLVACLGRLGLG